MDAIIVDLDGTLCKSQHVDAFTDVGGKVDWSAWMETNAFATVNEWCRQIVLGAQAMGTKIIFLTARTGSEQGVRITDGWLKNNGFMNYELIMRTENDYRPDNIIKMEIYNTRIMPYYNTLFAIDDKRRVVDMWRTAGVPALHCADY